jgi:branched-chain amino acid transport system ATP-binding protein
MALLEVQGLRAAYGNIEVLHGLDLRVEEGEVVTLIGANGAGKSTTLRCLSRLHDAKAGKIVFAGKDLASAAAHDVVRLGLVHSPEGRRVFARMSVAENLDLGAYIRDDKAQIATDLQQVYDLFPVLAERREQLAGTLSGGEQQMLAMGRAMMTRPRLLLLDEPSLGLAPLIVARIFEVIATLNQRGTTILLVEQNARLALKAAHRGYVLETGSLTMQGAGRDLLADPRIQAAYLGEA